jgi:hypothetical protein
MHRSRNFLFPALLLVLCGAVHTASAESQIRKNGSAWAAVDNDGTIRINGSAVGKFESDGTVRKNGSVIGKIDSDGTIRDQRSQSIGKIESAGTLRKNGSEFGAIESGGTIRKHGSSWGSATNTSDHNGKRAVAAALVFFGDFFK